MNLNMDNQKFDYVLKRIVANGNNTHCISDGGFGVAGHRAGACFRQRFGSHQLQIRFPASGQT